MNQDLTLKVGFDIDKFQKELSKTNGMLSKWSAGVQNSLMGVAAGFSAMAVGQFALDVSKLAGEAEGVRAAFDKLPAATQLMLDLKAATSGTVSELDLMKRAVTASNFGIQLEALPKLLEFASIRAKQTGQSVDYLVDSIVTGIGRKSPLILDNLGISTTRLKEKFGGAALEAQSIADVAKAVGEIAGEELEKMGTMSENASTKIERLSASWTNLKVAIGDAANGTGIMGTVIDALNMQMQVFASNNLSLIDKLIALANPVYAASAAAEDLAKTMGKANEEAKKQAQVIKEVDRAMASGNAKAYIAAQQQHVYYNEILAEYNKRVAETEQQKATAIKETTKAIEDNSAVILKRANSTAGGLTGGNMGMLPGLGNLSTSTMPFDAMNKALAELKARNEETTKSFEAQRQAIIGNAAALGEMIGSAIGAANSVGQAFANMASVVVKAIGDMIMAKMINAALDDKASNGFFPAKIALVAAAIGTAQMLLRKIGQSSSGGGAGRVSAAGGGVSSNGTRMDGLGQRIQLEVGWTGDAGKVLKTIAINQDRKDSRTRAN